MPKDSGQLTMPLGVMTISTDEGIEGHVFVAAPGPDVTQQLVTTAKPMLGRRGTLRRPQSSTRRTTAAPVSPAAQPVNRPVPPPRWRSSSISSVIERSPVGPWGWPKIRLQP